MKKSDDAFPCRLTGSDGSLLWSGTVGSMREAVRKLKRGRLNPSSPEGKLRQDIADKVRGAACPKPEAPDAD